jgi:sugar/nucleoside kinase (ribokinase family)
MYDVTTICNALIDLTIKVKEEDLVKLDLLKGQMHLVDSKTQKEIINFFSAYQPSKCLGGSSLNTIKTLARLGKKTLFTGAIGADEFGNDLKRQMQDFSIEENLYINKENATGSCVVLVTPDGERTMNTDLGASCLYDESAIPYEKLKQTKIFHVSGYQWEVEKQRDVILKAATFAKSQGALISFDLADPGVVERHKHGFCDFICDVADIVFANRKEAYLLYGLSPQETANKIARFGNKIAVIKLDAQGAIVQKDSQYFCVDALKTSVVDSTGAGDMFASGFLYGFGEGKSLKDCAYLGTLLAANVISALGTEISDNLLIDIKKGKL